MAERTDAKSELPEALSGVQDTTRKGLLDHVAVERRIGVLLVRRGGCGAGVFQGTKLLNSKVGSRHVQGRSKAGGRSQQRFARRRECQARVAFDAAVRILLLQARTFDALICGGDRTAVGACRVWSN